MGSVLWNRNDFPFLAQKAKQVYGVEIVPQAIDDAKNNAKINDITNAEFYVGKAEEVLPDIIKNMKRHITERQRTRMLSWSIRREKAVRKPASDDRGYAAGESRVCKL